MPLWTLSDVLPPCCSKGTCPQEVTFPIRRGFAFLFAFLKTAMRSCVRLRIGALGVVTPIKMHLCNNGSRTRVCVNASRSVWPGPNMDPPILGSCSGTVPAGVQAQQ